METKRKLEVDYRSFVCYQAGVSTQCKYVDCFVFVLKEVCRGTVQYANKVITGAVLGLHISVR